MRATRVVYAGCRLVIRQASFLLTFTSIVLTTLQKNNYARSFIYGFVMTLLLCILIETFLSRMWRKFKTFYLKRVDLNYIRIKCTFENCRTVLILSDKFCARI